MLKVKVLKPNPKTNVSCTGFKKGKFVFMRYILLPNSNPKIWKGFLRKTGYTVVLKNAISFYWVLNRLISCTLFIVQ